MTNNRLTSSYIETPLGKMLTIASNECLYLLAFVDQKNENSIVKLFQRKVKSTVTLGTNGPISSIKNELASYFQNKLTVFKTPIHLTGSPFQKKAWYKLLSIPYGETMSYQEQALSIGRPTAYRAIANANGANNIAIVIPCHRVITSSGTLGGYSAGVERKQWLINHEIRLRTRLRSDRENI